MNHRTGVSELLRRALGSSPDLASGAMRSLIDNLMSFGREHAGCDKIDGDVVGEYVEVVCSCGARMKRAAGPPREEE